MLTISTLRPQISRRAPERLPESSQPQQPDAPQRPNDADSQQDLDHQEPCHDRTSVIEQALQHHQHQNAEQADAEHG